MTAPELKPCPFCGGEASASGYVKYGKPLTDVLWDGGIPITEAFFCNCIACGVTNISGHIGRQTRELSITAWNTRADISQAAIAAAMMGAVDKCYAASASNNYYVSKTLADTAERIKASIPTNAIAALDAVKVRVRCETLDKVAEKAQRHAPNFEAIVIAMKGGK